MLRFGSWNASRGTDLSRAAAPSASPEDYDSTPAGATGNGQRAFCELGGRARKIFSVEEQPVHSIRIRRPTYLVNQYLSLHARRILRPTTRTPPP